MIPFKITFINKIKRDTVEISYTATTENAQSNIVFKGSQVFYREYLNPVAIANGWVAIRAIINVLNATPANLILNQVSLAQSPNREVLNLPSQKDFETQITENHLINHVLNHQDDNHQIIIDTKLIPELRIG